MKLNFEKLKDIVDKKVFANHNPNICHHCKKQGLAKSILETATKNNLKTEDEVIKFVEDLLKHIDSKERESIINDIKNFFKELK